MSPGLRRTLAVFVVAKVLAVTALLVGRDNHYSPIHSWNFHAYSDKDAGAWLAFINWDGQHYLKIALGGYPMPPDPTTAFYPMFPALVALGMRLGMDPIVSGLVIVTLASALAFILFTKLLPEEDKGSLWLFASFPTAFFLSVVYSEALFIAGLLGLLWALRDPRRAALAFVCALLLPLTRGQGLWLALPLVLALIFPGPLSQRSLRGAAIGYALGVCAYLAVYELSYGDPFLGIAAQRVFVFHNSIDNIFDLPRFVAFMLTPPKHFLDVTNSGFDKAMIVVSFAALAYGIRRSPDVFLATAWACFALVPALMGEGGSYGRHALLAWMCFALVAGPALPVSVRTPLIAAGFLLQVHLAWQFGGNNWVG
jgi:hypothetical protein